MKQLCCLILAFSLCLALLGCGSDNSSNVLFYYCRSADEFQYFKEDGVIAPEKRDLTGHHNDLRYLVSLYLAGPLNEELITPFPKNTRLISVQVEENTVQIELSEQGSSLTDSAFSLACACLTLTCLDYTACTEVTIISGERTITMNSESIVLFDAPLPQESTGG